MLPPMPISGVSTLILYHDKALEENIQPFGVKIPCKNITGVL